MKLSTLIAELEALQTANGDIDVSVQVAAWGGAVVAELATPLLVKGVGAPIVLLAPLAVIPTS